jgi:hypothetical protein
MVKIPKTQYENLYSRYIAGERIVNLSEELGVTRGSVGQAIRQYCKENNLSIVNRPHRPHVNWQGRVFGDLVVLSMLPPLDKQGHYRCLCKCLKCGNTEFIVAAKNLPTRTNPTCGCETWKRKKGKSNPTFRGYEEISGNFWNYLTRNARQRNIEMNITIQEAWELYILQEKKCALSGVEISFGESNYDETTASLDRIDSRAGYIQGNIQWVHKQINFSKQRLTNTEFLNMCQQVVCHHEATNKK